MILSGLRRKSAITTSRDLLNAMAAMQTGSAGVSVTPDSAMQQVTVYACVRVLSQTISSLPFHMFRKAGDERNKVDHSLAKLLGLKPNNFQTAQQFFSMLDACLELRGNFYANIVKGRGAESPVLGLIPMHPDGVTVTQNDDWSLSYSYRSKGGTVQDFEQGQVFHVTGLSLDGITGLSPIQYQRDTVGLAKAQENHGAALFKNGARPLGFVKHPNYFRDQKAIDDFRDRFTQTYSGENAYKVAVLENGMEWQPMTMTSEDSQWLESRKFQAQEICSLFGVPSWKLGHEAPKYSNAEQSQIQFVQEAITPRLVAIEQAIATQLLTEADRDRGIYPKFTVDGLLRGDSRTRWENHQRAIQMGVLSPNEVRALEDRNPRDGGDVYLTPVNMTTNPLGDNDTPADTPDT